MKFKNLKKTVILVLAVSFFASCNRGYGCPTNFSLADAFDFLVSAVALIF